MDDNIKIDGMINIEEYVKNIESQLNDVIKNATYSELITYLKMLPKDSACEDYLLSWGGSFLNEYYKIIGKLDEINTQESEELKYKIYILYLKENHNNEIFSFDGFITFSRLLNTTFSNYKPNKTRRRDKEPYQSGDKEIDYIVNKVVRTVLHKPHPHAYEITNFRLKILVNVLTTKSRMLLKEEFDRIDLDDTFLTNTLSTHLHIDIANMDKGVSYGQN